MRAESFDRDVGRLIDDLDHYYLLGFSPDDTRDRDFHPLDVASLRPGMTVRFRRGYKPGEAPKGLRNSRPLARLARRAAGQRRRAADVRLAGGGAEDDAHAYGDTIEVRADRAKLAEATATCGTC